MKPVVIFTTFNLMEVELHRSRLEAAGFHPFIANENAAAWGGSSPINMLRLEVPETEAVEAKVFLDAT